MWPHIAPATRPLAQGFPRAREERPRRLEAEGTVTTLHSDRHACTRVTSRSGEQLFARHQFGTVHMHRLADLHLDTLPYNAHSTAADCTYAAVPHLTVAGEQERTPHVHHT